MFRQISDPRGRQGRRHPLEAMLASIVCSILCGARSVSAIEEWIHLQEPAVWHALGFTRRPPRYGAFRNLLIALPAEMLEQVLTNWITGLIKKDNEACDSHLQPVAIDGKSLCGSISKHSRSVHLLSLFDHRTGCVLSQQHVASSTNELKTAWPLLRTIVLEGRVITGDAMFCNRGLCRQILDSGGHYLIEVKANQENLKQDIEAEFKPAFSPRGPQAAA